jgi:RNA-directed DNA polymerase
MPDEVGQLTFTFALPETAAKDEAEATQVAVPETGPPPAATRRKPPRPRKWHSLIDKVYALRNLQSAWERVRANQGAPGVDGMTIDRFTEGAEERLQRLSQELRGKTYRPQPVRRVFIPKSGGGQRHAQRAPGIPTVRDRIVQQALLQVLSPIFERKFSARSHGFRPGRGCGTALEVVDRAVRHGYGWVVDADLQSFFDTVDHEKLIDAVAEEVADGGVLKLIRRVLQAGVSLPETAGVEPTELGTPQGGPLSPLLANVYLHAFDRHMVAAGYGLVRYADDFVIFAKSESEANAALELARAVLEGQLGLRLHPEKTGVVSVATGFEFLGFHYYRDTQEGPLRKEVRPKSAQRFREGVRVRTPRLTGGRRPQAARMTRQRLAKNQRLQAIIGSLNRYLDGWHGYFRDVWSAYPETPFRYYDSFVRRRLRASICGEIGNGLWNRVLPNALLRDLGLRALDERQRSYRCSGSNPTRKGRSGGEPYAGKLHVRFGKAGGLVTPP